MAGVKTEMEHVNIFLDDDGDTDDSGWAETASIQVCGDFLEIT